MQESREGLKGVLAQIACRGTDVLSRPDAVRMKWLVCEDGTYLSVAAAASVGSLPFRSGGPYTHVEVGYPSVLPPPQWAQEYEVEPGVYRRVPVEAVQEWIDEHGGEAAAFSVEDHARNWAALLANPVRRGGRRFRGWFRG
ncbi:hypothetical protein [Streptomyces sp. NPDC002520]